MRKSLFSAAVLSTLHFASASTIGSAQVATPTPVPPQQIAPTREEIERTRPQAEAPRSAKLTVDGDIERAPCALDAPAYANIRTPINEAVFNNLQGIGAEELRQSYASLLGPDKPISTICTIRDAAATALRRKGYLAAVQVPVQKIENGVVRFEVLFARVVAIRVRGNAGKAENLLAGYLSHLTDDKIFNRYAAERYILLAKDLPGYEVRLALKPAGTNPGELVGEVSVIHTPFEASASLQNLSSHSSGRWTGSLAVQYHGLLGGDRVTASVSSTADFKEQQVVQLGYDKRIGSDGLTLVGNFTYAWTEPSVDIVTGTGTKADLTARTLFATGEARYPIVRTQSFSLLGAGGLDYLNQTVKLKRFAPTTLILSRDHLRVGFLRLDMDAADVSDTRPPVWRASGTLEFRQGLDIFNASSRLTAATPTNVIGPSRRRGDPTSTLIRGSAVLEYVIGKGFSIAATPRFQLAFDPVLSFEEFSGGNYSIGRGYDPGTITGDDGFGAGFEVRLPRLAPWPKLNLQMQPFAFVDAAWTHNKRFKAADIGIKNDHLISAGAGVRALLDYRFRLDATVAVPMERAGLQTRNKDPRFLIVLTSKLWPWNNR